MSELTERILSEAVISDRPGGYYRLEIIAADVASLERKRDAAMARIRGAVGDYEEQYRRADEAEDRVEEAERRIAAALACYGPDPRLGIGQSRWRSADEFLVAIRAALHPVAETTDDWTDPQPWLYRDGTRTAHKLPQMHVVRRPRIRAEYEAETTESEKNDE